METNVLSSPLFRIVRFLTYRANVQNEPVECQRRSGQSREHLPHLSEGVKGNVKQHDDDTEDACDALKGK